MQTQNRQISEFIYWTPYSKVSAQSQLEQPNKTMHKAVNSKQVSTSSNTLRWSLSIAKKASLVGRSEECTLHNIPTKSLHFLQSELGQPQVLLVDFKRVFYHKLSFTALAIMGHILQHFLTYFQIDEKIETCLHSENRFLWQHFNKSFSKAFIFSIFKT